MGLDELIAKFGNRWFFVDCGLGHGGPLLGFGAPERRKHGLPLHPAVILKSGAHLSAPA
jgi:hypothetical protein